MSGTFEQSFTYAATDDFDAQFSAHENPLATPTSINSGPAAPYSSMGFWYRPEPQDVFFHHHSSHTSQTPSAPEQSAPVKHRRTRSGCFTCRSRRVKCDETRPLCDRCRKGNRECVFPQATPASKRAKDESNYDHEGSRSNATTLEIIQDDSDDEPTLSPRAATSRLSNSRTLSNTLSRKQKYRQESANSHQERSPTPSDLDSTASKTQSSPTQVHSPTRTPAVRWAGLKAAEQQLLQFHQDSMTFYHYFLRIDPEDFIHVEFIDLALGFEPLFYAVLAFISYHRELRSEHGEFKEFWKYYCRSIILLRKWLESPGERHDAVLLTILQLAAFEEYLGDWPNLVCHHRAAYSILISLYSPETIMSTERSRMIFDWFGRLDIIASLMAGADTVLDRQWFVSSYEWYKTKYEAEKIDIGKALQYFFANFKLVGFDMASSFAKAAQIANFAETAAAISERMDKMRLEMQSLHDSADLMPELQRVRSTEGTGSPEVFDPHPPPFTGDLWPLNYMWMDWYAGQQMHLYQTAKILHDQMQTAGASASAPQAQSNRADESAGDSEFDAHSSGLSPRAASTMTTHILKPDIAKRVPEQLTQLSVVQCQIYEAIERHSSASSGGVLGCHVAMAFSTIFLRREPGLVMWARRKLANVERMGYMWPAMFRTSMARLWGVPEVVDWWLPDGGRTKSPLVDEIRAVVEDRNRLSVEMRSSAMATASFSAAESADGAENAGTGAGIGAATHIGRSSTETTSIKPGGGATGTEGISKRDHLHRTDLRDLRAIFDNLDLGIPESILDQDQNHNHNHHQLSADDHDCSENATIAAATTG